MTIDEAIAHAREVASENMDLAQDLYFDDEYDIERNDCLKCVEENEQLAEWLELLKWYQQGMEDIPSESGVLPKDVYRAGYNKAIDDFLREIKIDVIATTFGLRICDAERIAQQVKEGGTDGNSATDT